MPVSIVKVLSKPFRQFVRYKSIQDELTLKASRFFAQSCQFIFIAGSCDITLSKGYVKMQH